jgi:hypothetical protein
MPFADINGGRVHHLLDTAPIEHQSGRTFNAAVRDFLLS